MFVLCFQGSVFSLAFSEDCPFQLAIGGSKGKLKVSTKSSKHSSLLLSICQLIWTTTLDSSQVWDVLTDHGVANKFGKFANGGTETAPVGWMWRLNIPLKRKKKNSRFQFFSSSEVIWSWNTRMRGVFIVYSQHFAPKIFNGVNFSVLFVLFCRREHSKLKKMCEFIILFGN